MDTSSLVQSCRSNRNDERYTRFPADFRRFNWRASQLGSLLDKSPFPKKPLLHKIIECSMLVIHTERVIGSKMPSQCGLSTRVRESPRTPRTEFRVLAGGSINNRGKGLAYSLLISALLAPPLFPEDLLSPLELGVMRDMAVSRRGVLG